jgi:hypothetical protein
VWKDINLTADTHFFHVRLVAFQLIGRDRYETGGFDGAADTQATATFSGPGTIDEDESG